MIVRQACESHSELAISRNLPAGKRILMGYNPANRAEPFKLKSYIAGSVNKLIKL